MSSQAEILVNKAKTGLTDDQQVSKEPRRCQAADQAASNVLVNELREVGPNYRNTSSNPTTNETFSLVQTGASCKSKKVPLTQYR